MYRGKVLRNHKIVNLRKNFYTTTSSEFDIIVDPLILRFRLFFFNTFAFLSLLFKMLLRSYVIMSKTYASLFPKLTSINKHYPTDIVMANWVRDRKSSCLFQIIVTHVRNMFHEKLYD